MKKIVLLSIALLAITGVYAQTNKQITSSINLDLLAPIKAIKNTHISGVGASLQIEIHSTKNLSYITSSGYSVITAKPDYKTIIQFPTMIGVKYKIIDMIYVQTAGGIAISNNGLGTNFIYAPSVSFSYGKFLTSVKYTSTVITGKDNDISTVGLGLIYKL